MYIDSIVHDFIRFKNIFFYISKEQQFLFPFSVSFGCFVVLFSLWSSVDNRSAIHEVQLLHIEYNYDNNNNEVCINGLDMMTVAIEKQQTIAWSIEKIFIIIICVRVSRWSTISVR